MIIFEDRIEAGRKLGNLLREYAKQEVVVYALPRGGVVVGAEVAKALEAPLDIIIAVKIADPLDPEKALGAVVQDRHSVLSDEVLKVDPCWIAEETERAIEKAITRHVLYNQKEHPISSFDQIAIIVDDGIATGLTIRAAIQELKIHMHPKKIIVAVPVAPMKVVREIEQLDNVEVLAILSVQNFKSVSSYYKKFPQIPDYHVLKIIQNFTKNTIFQQGKNNI